MTKIQRRNVIETTGGPLPTSAVGSDGKGPAGRPSSSSHAAKGAARLEKPGRPSAGADDMLSGASEHQRRTKPVQAPTRAATNAIAWRPGSSSDGAKGAVRLEKPRAASGYSATADWVKQKLTARTEKKERAVKVWLRSSSSDAAKGAVRLEKLDRPSTGADDMLSGASEHQRRTKPVTAPAPAVTEGTAATEPDTSDRSENLLDRAARAVRELSGSFVELDTSPWMR